MHTETSSKILSTQPRNHAQPSGAVAEPPLHNRRRDRRFDAPRGVVRMPCKPFEVYGTELELRKLLFGWLPSIWSSRHEVLNMSKGGLAFEARRPMPRRCKVTVQLWVPGYSEPFKIHGETRWCKRQGRRYEVGVQFAPFGKLSGMNDPRVLKVLRSLEAELA